MFKIHEYGIKLVITYYFDFLFLKINPSLNQLNIKNENVSLSLIFEKIE